MRIIWLFSQVKFNFLIPLLFLIPWLEETTNQNSFPVLTNNVIIISLLTNNVTHITSNIFPKKKN